MFAVLPLPPRGRRSLALPPKGPSPPRPSLQGRNSPGNHMKGRTVSFKERGGDNRIGGIASGGHTMSINCVMLRHTGEHQRSCFASCRCCKGHRQQTRAAHCKEVYEPEAAPVCPSAAGAHPSTALEDVLQWGRRRTAIPRTQQIPGICGGSLPAKGCCRCRTGSQQGQATLCTVSQNGATQGSVLH